MRKSDSETHGDANQMGQKREGLSERRVEGEKGVPCGWTGSGLLGRRGWDTPHSVNGLDKGQEMKVHTYRLCRGH